MAPSATTPPAELVVDTKYKRNWYPASLTNRNIPTFLQTPYVVLKQKKKKAKEVTSVGGTTAIARTLMMQGLYLFYRTPVKVKKKKNGIYAIFDITFVSQLFRPLRVDYLIMARALMPIDKANTKRFSFRYTSIGMITHAVKTKGVYL